MQCFSANGSEGRAPSSAEGATRERQVIDLRVFTNVPTQPACVNAISVMAAPVFDGLICPPQAAALRSWVVAAARHACECCSLP